MFSFFTMNQVRSIIKLSSWILTLPFYIYGLLKWREFNGHFLIQNRFPKISYILFYLTFILQTISLIEDWFYLYNISDEYIDFHITYLILSLTFTISGLILYRINLIYLKWKSIHPIYSLPPRQSFIPTNNNSNSSTLPSINKKRLKPPPIQSNNTIISVSNAVQKKIVRTNQAMNKIKNIYRSKSSMIILYFILFGSIIVYLSYTLTCLATKYAYFIVVIQFGALWICIVLSIINIKHKKVEEGINYISCLYSTYLIFAFYIITLLFF